MILSKKRRFLFLKGRKIAGTSIEVAVSPYCGADDILTPITPIDERRRVERGRHAQNYGANAREHDIFISTVRSGSDADLAGVKRPIGIFNNHMPLADIAARFEESLNGYNIFAVVRCPYRKLISWANMSLGLSAYKKVGSMSVEPQQIRRFIQRSIADGSAAMLDNSHIYEAPEGCPAVHILRFENLKEEFGRILPLLGIPGSAQLPHLKKGGAGVWESVETYLGADEIAAVNAMFDAEFDLYGYERL